MMDNLKNIILKTAMVFAMFLNMECHGLFAQQAGTSWMYLDRNVLTSLEQERMDHILNEGFTGEHWISELTLDPTASDLEITFPDTDRSLFIAERKKEFASGLFSWRGKTSDGSGSATFVWNRGKITGIFSLNGKRTYRIQPLSGSRHLIYRVNHAHVPAEESKEDYEKMKSRIWVPSESPHKPGEKENGETETGLLGNDCYIRILVGFDNVAGPSLADPVGFALECIELSNTIYANSEVNFEVELAFTTIYDDAASADIDDALAEWQFEFGDEKFENVYSDREQYDADFCILITEDFDGDYVGLAATILASYSSAFCVVEDGAAIDNLSFTHEIGHLMGARHDPYEDGSGDYNHGYIIHSEEVRTVMAYNTECSDNGYDCTRVQYFSNPDIDYLSTGKALGTADESHNERAIDENESEFKDFEPVVTDKTFLFPETISGEVYASVSAISSIQHVASYEVTDAASVVWSAGDWMLMEEGFFVEYGSTFEAKPEGCNASRLISSPEAAAGLVTVPSHGLLAPNPASGSSVLRIELPDDALVSASMYDLMGRELRNIIRGRTMSAGTHELFIGLDGFPSGTYSCRLFINGEPETLKLVVQH